MTSEPTEVIAIVEAAFALDLPWGGMGMAEAGALDDCANKEAVEEAREHDAAYAGKPWPAVPDSEVEWSYSAIHFLDDPSFRFYAPVLMTWSIRNASGEHRDSMLHESILDRLSRIWPKTFKKQERQAILAFVTYQAELERESLAAQGLRVPSDDENSAHACCTRWRRYCEADS